MRKHLYIAFFLFVALATPLRSIATLLLLLYGWWWVTRNLWAIPKRLWQHYRTWQLMHSEPSPTQPKQPSRERAEPVFIGSGDNLIDFALALGWPMAASYPQKQDNGRKRYPMQLHYFGLRTDLEHAQIRRQLPQKLQKHWFTLDLNRLQSTDEPRAAMAFACVRLSFYVESARRLGWLDETLHRQILLLNAERAKECFSGWQDFASAFVQGRSQWLARGRSDILGEAASTEQAQHWLNAPNHPWHQLPWPLAPIHLQKTLEKTH